MQSTILRFFANLFHALALWFDESVTGRLFNRIAACLTPVFKDSLLGRFFSKCGDGRWFSESLFGKTILWPIRLCQKIADKTSGFAGQVIATSGIVRFLSSWCNISLRVYGVTLLSFVVSFTLVRYLTPTGMNTASWFVSGGLVFISVFCILINRSIKNLFKGSAVLTTAGKLFCSITQNVDSKLFLQEPDLTLKRPLLCILFGVILAIPAALLPPLVSVFTAAVITYLVLVIYSTDFGFFTVMLAAPFLPTMVLAACCVLTAFSFGLRLLFNRNLELKPVPLAGYILIFAFTMILGTVNSFTFVKSLQILFLHLAFMLFYFVACQVLDKPQKWQAAITGFLLVSALVALYGIYQNFAGVSSTASWVDEEMFKQIKVRVYSTFDNPNVLGEYLVLMIPLALAVIWRKRDYGQKTLYTALLACLGLCLIFTWSRGAWLGVILAAGLFLLIMDKRWSLLAVLGICMIPMILGSDSAVAERILSIGNTADTSTAYRVSIWKGSISMIGDFGLAGIGQGSDAFSMLYPKYALAGANYALHGHNLFLQIWIETGIAGLVSFLVMILAFMKQSFTLPCYQNRDCILCACSIALAAAVAGFLFQGLTDNVWYNYKMVLLFWIVLSFASSARNLEPPQTNIKERSRL